MSDTDFKKMWSNWLIDIDQTTKDVAINVGDSPANLQKKIRNQSIRYKELAAIVEQYGYTIEIRKKD